MNAQLIKIKSKKLGVKIARSRYHNGFSVDKLSQLAGVSVNDFEKIEKGELCPTLPQLEAILYGLGISFDELNNNTDELSDTTPDIEVINRFSSLRNRVIGVSLRKARFEKNITPESLAEKCEISVDEIMQYESGSTPIPFSILEVLCMHLDIDPSSLLSESGPFSHPVSKTIVDKEENSMIPGYLNSFVKNPANLPYLELAKKLSEMDAAKLRNIAEGLLEITY